MQAPFLLFGCIDCMNKFPGPSVQLILSMILIPRDGGNEISSSLGTLVVQPRLITQFFRRCWNIFWKCLWFCIICAGTHTSDVANNRHVHLKGLVARQKLAPSNHLVIMKWIICIWKAWIVLFISWEGKADWGVQLQHNKGFVMLGESSHFAEQVSRSPRSTPSPSSTPPHPPHTHHFNPAVSI